MKKVTALFLVLALLLCNLLTVSAASDEAVAVDVAYLGEEGLVELTVSTEIAAAAGDFTITYDNRTLTLLEATVTADYYSPNSGTSTYAGSYVNRPAKAGTLAVLLFSYDAAAAGTTKVIVDVTVIDAEETATTITKTLTLELASDKSLCPSKNYKDLDMDAWYHEATDFVIENGIMNGVSDTMFDPNGTATRAMFVTVLGRLAGVDTERYGQIKIFDDVAADKWYTAYVNWAYENKIVVGRGSGLFCPQDPITRQEMVTILARFANSVGVDTTVQNADVLKGFTDADRVAAYAAEAFAWAVEQGIINGTGKGLEPRGLATRAQIAQIIYKFYASFE